MYLEWSDEDICSEIRNGSDHENIDQIEERWILGSLIQSLRVFKFSYGYRMCTEMEENTKQVYLKKPTHTVVMDRMLFYPKVEDEQVASNGERRDSEAGDQEHELNDTRERRNTKCTSREQNERSFAWRTEVVRTTSCMKI